ncbi:MAG: HigA family addiction module antitoxin [Dehalococcoidia bacterium]|nr:HigA family addiction module antitoxin [Dehalococcoidia bacterium]
MSVSNGMRPVHPGEILDGELEELGMNASALADALAVPDRAITAILKGENGITADIALRLSHYFGTSPEFWLNLQKTFELRVAKIEYGNEIAEQVKPRVTAGAFGN